MVFNSLIFLLFLALVLPVYYRLKHRAQNWFLLLASYFFYGWWDPRFVLLLGFTSVFDYCIARGLEQTENPTRRKWLLASSMTVDLTVLGIFKYFNFFAESAAALLTTMGFHASLPTLHVILPVGISFYTFLSMSYTIDVYRGALKASHRPVDYLLFVSYFPHLVAGPIVRASWLLPQCEQPRILKPDQVVNGFWLIALGYFKKMVIGDRLAQVVDWGFSQPLPPFTDANAWLIIYAFAFQIYGDFAGYTDIARGLAKIMGFELVENFRAPYLVTNPAAFWRNWHISLSSWFRDYVFLPLEWATRDHPDARRRMAVNLMFTMFLTGLWHGAGMAFILWGLYQGGMLVTHQLWSQRKGRRRNKKAAAAESGRHWQAKAVQAFQVFFFFHLTCFGWLLFRAGSLPAPMSQMELVLHYLKAMVTPLQHGWDPILWGILLLGGMGLFLQWKHDLMERFAEWPTRWQAAAVVLVGLAIGSLGVFEGAQFIYFQF